MPSTTYNLASLVLWRVCFVYRHKDSVRLSWEKARFSLRDDVEIRSDKALRFVRPRILETVYDSVSSSSYGHRFLFGLVAKTKQHDLVLHLRKQMELEGIAYDLYTLNITINCFCRLRCLKLGYEPDTVTFNTLLNGLCLEGRVFEAVELVDYLITLNTLVNGLCLKGYLSESVDINRPNGGNAPNDCTYNSLIRAHLGYGDSAKSATLIEEMKRCGFAADASTIKMVIDILVDGRLDKSFLDMLT
ncbi:hypothetical protein Bca101_088785 [Brassica carinata]